MKKARTKCYIYTRVSTAMQVDGYSLDAQREKLRKYADYEDMVIAGEYSDEGFSGKNIQGRHEFQQMLRDVQDGTAALHPMAIGWKMASFRLQTMKWKLSVLFLTALSIPTMV